MRASPSFAESPEVINYISEDDENSQVTASECDFVHACETRGGESMPEYFQEGRAPEPEGVASEASSWAQDKLVDDDTEHRSLNALAALLRTVEFRRVKRCATPHPCVDATSLLPMPTCSRLWQRRKVTV